MHGHSLRDGCLSRKAAVCRSWDRRKVRLWAFFSEGSSLRGSTVELLGAARITKGTDLASLARLKARSAGGGELDGGIFSHRQKISKRVNLTPPQRVLHRERYPKLLGEYVRTRKIRKHAPPLDVYGGKPRSVQDQGRITQKPSINGGEQPTKSGERIGGKNKKPREPEKNKLRSQKPAMRTGVAT